MSGVIELIRDTPISELGQCLADVERRHMPGWCGVWMCEGNKKACELTPVGNFVSGEPPGYFKWRCKQASKQKLSEICQKKLEHAFIVTATIIGSSKR